MSRYDEEPGLFEQVANLFSDPRCYIFAQDMVSHFRYGLEEFSIKAETIFFTPNLLQHFDTNCFNDSMAIWCYS